MSFFDDCDAVAEFIGQETLPSKPKTPEKPIPDRSLTKEEKQSDRVLKKEVVLSNSMERHISPFKLNAPTYVPKAKKRSNKEVSQTQSAPILVDFSCKRYVPKSKRKEMALPFDRRTSEFLQNYGEQLSDLCNSNNLYLLYSGKDIKGLENPLSMNNVVIVIVSGENVFAFNAISKADVVVFSLKNPFDLNFVPFKLKDVPDFAVDVNGKFKKLEVWHFVGITGSAGFVYDDFSQFYDDPTGVGSDVFVGQSQPEEFTVDWYFAFSTI
ncbi:hypothetical protein EIN_229250 [Entamoeba invadens IP1]|uniref:Uncharacterized protein n=1 Tax=Entamoeba invadens IP1 TaxID=370355 RepID=A0A0A1U2X4_ENTIV|nr:hypothetical protein EIN_229250 [Entamoeba invadens IP1]ELP88402.1 hypothetical protein EIN_229250 [Entamoeba invadens IP1]|eukprot:XP_004255173.1 hypothetical protein EIN_229250 [Entamoeba invadens IP1]